MVKFPDPIIKKDKSVFYLNNTFSEYIGSHVFRFCKMNVQNTILGIYRYDEKEKIVCACEDFTDREHVLYEFENLVLSTNPEVKICIEVLDIMKVLEANDHFIDFKKAKEFFEDYIYYCLKEDGKRIHYMKYIKEKNNEDCNQALKIVFPNIEIENIKKWIQDIGCLSEIRKQFYIDMIVSRYEILRKIYQSMSYE